MRANDPTRGQSVNSVPRTIDEVTSLIENDRCRLVVLFLDKQSESMKIGQLADAIASVETDTPMYLIGAEERKSAYTALYQNHLEKLDNAGVVKYEKRPGIILSDRDGVCPHRAYSVLDEELFCHPYNSIGGIIVPFDACPTRARSRMCYCLSVRGAQLGDSDASLTSN